MPTVPVERAADSPDEFALLCGIADHPADDARRLVYADWLEERGDPRGEFLRRFMEAFRAGGALPDAADFPRAWCDVVGVTLRVAMSDAGVYRDDVFALARPAILLQADPDLLTNPVRVPAALGTTRLGDVPDLPTGTPYPVDADGRPLVFIGQFNLADLAGTVLGRAFPAAGLLSLFGHQYDRPAGRPWAFLFTPGARLERVSPGDSDPEPTPPRANLRLVETLRLPPRVCDRPELDLSPEESARYRIFLDESFPAVDMLGGFADVSDAVGDVLAVRPDWVQLAMFTGEGGWEWGTGNGQSLVFALPADDLKAGRFDRVAVERG